MKACLNIHNFQGDKFVTLLSTLDDDDDDDNNNNNNNTWQWFSNFLLQWFTFPWMFCIFTLCQMLRLSWANTSGVWIYHLT